ncbi:hypothetical protein AB3R30_23355 [Leptolyngbyaceae cyanobacterium UHCC 1019]
MSGKVVDKVARRQAKESANWRCQNPVCQRDCLQPRETLSDFMGRIGKAQWLDLLGELTSQRLRDRNQKSESTCDPIQPFIMKAMSDGNGGYLALCGSCAIKFIQLSPQQSFVQTKLELLGQLRLL